MTDPIEALISRAARGDDRALPRLADVLSARGHPVAPYLHRAAAGRADHATDPNLTTPKGNDKKTSWDPLFHDRLLCGGTALWRCPVWRVHVPPHAPAPAPAPPPTLIFRFFPRLPHRTPHYVALYLHGYRRWRGSLRTDYRSFWFRVTVADVADLAEQALSDGAAGLEFHRDVALVMAFGRNLFPLTWMLS